MVTLGAARDRTFSVQLSCPHIDRRFRVAPICDQLPSDSRHCSPTWVLRVDGMVRQRRIPKIFKNC